MVFKVYSVFDKAIESFGNLLLYRSEAMAKRDFEAAMSGDLVSVSDSYDLFYIGDFDIKSGIIASNAQMLCVMRGFDIKQRASVDFDSEMETE